MPAETAFQQLDGRTPPREGNWGLSIPQDLPPLDFILLVWIEREVGCSETVRWCPVEMIAGIERGAIADTDDRVFMPRHAYTESLPRHCLTAPGHI